MRPHACRHRAAIAVLLVMPFAAAACGGGGESNSSSPPVVSNLAPAAYVKHSARQTAKATSVHMTMKAAVNAAGQQATITGSGDFDQPNHVGSMHADFSAGGMSGSIDEVISGTTVYLSSPLFSAALPQGKTWLKLDLQKAGKAHGIDFSTLLSQSPSRSLGQLRGLVNVKKVGTEQVGGTATTHYRGHIDLSKVPQGAKLEKLTHATYTPFDIWVGNDDGYIRRLRFGVATASGGNSVNAVMTMEFSDFGKTVHVTEPPASEVYDATNLAIPGLGH